MQSINNRHKHIIRAYIPPIEIQKYGEIVANICSISKLCKYTYTMIIKNLPYNIKGKPKWENSFRKQIDHQEWAKIFTLPKEITLDSQTRIFQYKIIHRILPTNSLLYTYTIRDNPWCDLCPNVMENIEHTFHICPEKLRFWYEIADWIMPEIDLYPYINTENIILGIYKECKLLENAIILAVKRYIYINKCKN